MTTALQESRALWNSMPGWGIVVDLMPPEILAARRARAIRRYVALGMAVLVVLLAMAFAFSFMKKHQAQNALNQARDEGTSLQAQVRQYADVITIQGTVTGVQQQVATLLKTDVDFPKMLGLIQKAQPRGVVLTQLTMSVDAPATSAGGGATAGGAGGILDTSGLAHIGTVTITGTATKATDVSAYVDALRELNGVVEPYPTSNVASSSGVTFNIQLTLTDKLFTHRFDAQQTGGK